VAQRAVGAMPLAFTRRRQGCRDDPLDKHPKTRVYVAGLGVRGMANTSFSTQIPIWGTTGPLEPILDENNSRNPYSPHDPKYFRL
jgi:hypothetical protein